jgi:hypothetical protein
MIPAIAPNQSRNGSKWTAPRYPVHTRVLFSKDPTWRDASPGYIVVNGNNGMASLLVSFYFPGHGISVEPRDDCYHADDPNIPNRPADFWDGTNGVYKLAPIEEEAFALKERVERLEALLLNDRKQGANEPIPEKRGPGRPPKTIQA